MSNTAHVVEIRINGQWRPAQRADDDYATEEQAIEAAKRHYPITCRIQAERGPVGIRVMAVVVVT
jgi:hypothetical protein